MERKKWSTFKGRPLVTENSPFDPPFTIQPVEPKILVKWKAPQVDPFIAHELNTNVQEDINFGVNMFGL